jgi:hypothetical protein
MNMRQYPKQYLAGFAMIAHFVCMPSAHADVFHYQKSPVRKSTYVENESWQPDGFENAITIPAVFVKKPGITINGRNDEIAWEEAVEIPIALSRGTIEQAWIKALYTDNEVYISVRWVDQSENREHHPWTWSEDQQKYVAGPQIEDSLLLSFEAGCEWTPSLLGGYQYDFDGWYWMAARTDPLGQALDTLGTVSDRVIPGFNKYQSRVVNDDWIMKFTDPSKDKFSAKWEELDRVYMISPVTKELYVAAVPDGGSYADSFDYMFVEQLPAPDGKPLSGQETKTFPQFRPLQLTGDLGDISAKGHWEDGFWTVEFGRKMKTPRGGLWDLIFERLTQFSIHVLDQQEGFDKVSESKRLFLEFVEQTEPLLVSK